MYNIYCRTLNLVLVGCLIGSKCEPIELYDRLNHLIGYVTNHVESQQHDLMLGIFMCEAQLVILNATDTSSLLSNVLKNIQNLRENFERHSNLHSICEQNGLHISKVAHHLLNTGFWVRSLQRNDENVLFYGNITTAHEPTISIENFANRIDIGAPSPVESDECLAELFDPIYCTISVRCLNIMSAKTESHGYHLTHKLLYYMIMKYQNCDSSLPIVGNSLDSHIYTLCSLILFERNIVVQLNIPDALKDLFLEQTLLCGLNGFAIFLDEYVINEIISWQLPSGCYEYFDGAFDVPVNVTPQATMVIKKRSVTQLNGNCSDHMTGLAAAAFGLFAKITYAFGE